MIKAHIQILSFNTQPREGGCACYDMDLAFINLVSTHSRAKAAALSTTLGSKKMYSFNTQPRESGCRPPTAHLPPNKRFNTQPREGGCSFFINQYPQNRSFNTQPREGGCSRLDLFY